MTKLRVLTMVALLSPLSVLIVEAGNQLDPTLDEIARHREWTRVTPAPFPVFAISSLNFSSTAI